MQTRLKTTLKVLGFIAITALLAYGLYFILFRPDLKTPSPTTPTPTPTTTTGNLPSAGGATGTKTPTTPDSGTGSLPTASPIAQGGPTLITRLTDSKILAANHVGTNAAAYYDPNDGKFYRIDRDGNISTISNTAFPKADTVVFDNKSDKAVLEFPDGSNILYDLTSDRQITMPAHWSDFAFTAAGDQVIGKAIADANNASLVVMNTDGSQAYAIANMGANADKVDIAPSPNNNFVALSRTGQAQAGFGRSAILLIDQTGEAPGSIIVDGTNFSPKWSPSGSHILYSTSSQANEDRPGLWYVKASGSDIGTERANLDVATWAEKCTFRDETYILCAVPREIKNYEGSSPYYNSSIDDLYEINVLTGRKTMLAQPTISVRMFNLTLSTDESTMYFNDQDGRLSYIKLK